MAEAALNLADWILLADVGEHMRQKNDGHRGLARGDVQAALEAGCGLMLRWIGDDGREACREFLKRDSWEDILVWAGLPQRLCVQLPPNERKGNLPYPLAYLPVADAVRFGLWPVSESPQTKQQSEQQPKLSGKEWVEAAFKRRPDELLKLGISKAGETLAKESKTAPDCAKPLGKGHCINLLRELKVFPKKPRNSPKQRPK